MQILVIVREATYQHCTAFTWWHRDVENNMKKQFNVPPVSTEMSMVVQEFYQEAVSMKHYYIHEIFKYESNTTHRAEVKIHSRSSIMSLQASCKSCQLGMGYVSALSVVCLLNIRQYQNTVKEKSPLYTVCIT